MDICLGKATSKWPMNRKLNISSSKNDRHSLQAKPIMAAKDAIIEAMISKGKW